MQARLEAPPEAAWEALTDHAGWTRWSGVKEMVLRQQGDPPPNGLGAIRVMRAGGLAIEEEVTAFDPPQLFGYQVVAGLPVREHRGEVRFDPVPGGTRATWRVRFAPLIPGTGGLLAVLLRAHLERLLHRLAAALAA